jgi:D-alanyl-D-alanine carboxypeptidase
MRLEMKLRGLVAGLALAGIWSTNPAFANPAILFDLANGKVVVHQDAFKRWYPASLTKLMTAYVTFRAVAAGELALDSPIEITKHAAAEPPAKMGLKAGSIVTLDNALKMMLVKSANDIAMAVGENVGGSQEAFAERMNAEAQRLGMTGSHWVNPNGLFDPDQYTTARDLALLVSAIRREFPQYAPYFAIQGLKAGKKTLMGYNMLVGRYDGADGMKTGFVCSSGFNMIGSATRNGRSFAAVVLGERSALKRTEKVAGLLDHGFASTGGQIVTLSTLAAYDAGLPATDMRAEICERKKAPAQSEEATQDPKADPSQWLAKIRNPLLVKVGTGGATGPVPLMWRDHVEYADVPIPQPRPDYPLVKQAAQGDALN